MTLLSTVTHARLRASQGDLGAARRILREVLAVSPADDEARGLLAAWSGRAGSAGPAEPGQPVAAPTSASAAELSARFRQALRGSPRMSEHPAVQRLERWLAAIRGDA